MGTWWRAESVQSLEPFPPTAPCLTLPALLSRLNRRVEPGHCWPETQDEGGLWENLRKENSWVMEGHLRKIPTQWVESYRGIHALSTEHELWGKLSRSHKVPRAPGCEMEVAAGLPLDEGKTVISV